MAGVQHFGQCQPRHRARTAPVVEHGFAELLLSDTLTYQPFDLSAPQACRHLHQLAGHCAS